MAGNTFDEQDAAGVWVHRYGPHIFHTADERAYQFVSRFTDWFPLRHRVLASVRGQLLPVPFNLISLRMAFAGERAERLTQKPDGGVRLRARA